MTKLNYVTAIRAGCSEGDFGIHQPCRYPDCACEEVPNGIRAALDKAAAPELYAVARMVVDLDGDPGGTDSPIAQAARAALAKARGEAP